MEVFISHSTDDENLYNSLLRDLIGENHNVWDPRSMEAGKSLSAQISEATQQSDICIFLATHSSIESVWCAAELGAFWGAGKTIIAYFPNTEIDMSKLPPHLEGQLWVSSKEELIKSINTTETTKKEFQVDVVNKDIELDEQIFKVIDSDHSVSRADLIHYSGDNISKVIEQLLNNNIEVNLLLAHPIQLIKSGNIQLIDVQLTKMKTFNNKVKSDFPNSEKLKIRYYTSPPSLRGLYLDNGFCSTGWYTHCHNEIHGHDNPQLMINTSGVTKECITSYFNRIFKKLWEDSVPYQEDKKNIESLLSLKQIAGSKLDGIVVRGHGVASGKNIKHGTGTINQQKHFFKEIDWEQFWPGTINVSISPKRCLWKKYKPTYEGINWAVDQPREDFCISMCKIQIRNTVFDAWAYYPHPRTKLQNLHDSTTIEIIAPRIEGLEYGDKLVVSLNEDDFIVLQ